MCDSKVGSQTSVILVRQDYGNVRGDASVVAGAAVCEDH